MINGLFEIHITVDIDDFVPFSFYCWENKLKRMLACSKYGDHPQQLMLTCWKNGTEVEAIKYAKVLAEDLKLKGMNPIRTKVESIISNDGVPENNTRFSTGQGHHYYTKKEEEYFEYHVKMEIDKPGEWEVLAKAIKPVNAHLSYNGLNRERIVPIVTLRVYGKGKREAEKTKDRLFELMKKAGFNTHNQIQKEYSVYDDNPNLDLNWLFTENKYFWQ